MSLQENLHILLRKAPITVNEYEHKLKDATMVKETILKLKTAKPRILLGLIMSSAMATILSFVLTFSYVGFSPDFLTIWLHRLELSLIVGPPVALTLFPLVTKLIGKILRS